MQTMCGFACKPRLPRAAAAAVAALGALGCGGGPAAPDAAPDAPGRLDAAVDAPVDAASPDAADAGDLPPGIICLLAVPVALPGEVFGDTTELVDFTGASCSPGAEGSPQMFFTVSAGGGPIDVVLDVDGVDVPGRAPFDAVLSARADCFEPATELGCADGGFGEHLELLGVSGDISVIVDGTPQFGGAAAGAFALRTAPRKISGPGEPCDPAGVASRCEAGHACAAGECLPDSPRRACDRGESLTAALGGGPVERAAITAPYASDWLQGGCAFDPAAGASEHVYRIDVAAPSALVATTDFAETRFDTVLYVRGGDCGGPELGCHDDVDAGAGNFRSRLSAALAPGTHYLIVDGSSAPGMGPYRLRVELSPL